MKKKRRIKAICALLRRSKDGSYETGLIWKIGQQPLPTNEKGSIARLKGLLRKDLLKEYDNNIQNQLKDGIIERLQQHADDVKQYADDVQRYTDDVQQYADDV